MNHQDKAALFHLVGWILFLICALLFIYIAMRDSDLVLTLAGFVFLGGCIAFLIPLLLKDSKARNLPPGDGPSQTDG